MSALLRPLGDEIASVYGSYKSKKEVKKIAEGDELDILCSDGLNYHVVVKECGDIGRLHFRQWSRKHDYVGSFDELYLAKRGTFSEGISAVNTYPAIIKKDSLGDKSKVNSGTKAATVSLTDPRSQNFPSGTRYPEDFLSKPRFPSSSSRKRALEEPDNSNVKELSAVVDMMDVAINDDDNPEIVADENEDSTTSASAEYNDDKITPVVDLRRRSTIAGRLPEEKVTDDVQQRNVQVEVTIIPGKLKKSIEVKNEKDNLEMNSVNNCDETNRRFSMVAKVTSESSVASKENKSRAIELRPSPINDIIISNKVKSQGINDTPTHQLVRKNQSATVNLATLSTEALSTISTKNVEIITPVSANSSQKFIPGSATNSILSSSSSSTIASATICASSSSSSSFAKSVPCYQSQVHRATQISFLKSILNTEKSLANLTTAIDVVSNHPIVFQPEKSTDGQTKKQLYTQKQLLELLQARRKIDEVIQHLLGTL